MLSTRKKLILSLLIICGAVFLLLRFSPINGLEEFERSHYSIPLYSSQENLLAVLSLENGLRRQFLSIDDLPGDLEKIILGSEDRRFYFHPGFDLISLSRAVLQYIQGGEIHSGASTITMQLSRMINPKEKGVKGKIYEIFNAVRLETRYSKKNILELYINHLPFGSNIEGIKSAAYYFLGKDMDSLNREDVLILMMIPRRPEDYNPIENPVASREAVFRTLGRIDQEISKEKISSIYNDIQKHSPLWPSQAQHFVQMIRSRISEDMWQEGAPLFSSLDEEFQMGARTYLNNVLNVTGDNRISNGAVLAIDNASGKILAYIGSADFDSEELNGQIDGVHILRQPGSTLKPFLYAKAIESGYSPSSILPDIPMEFGSREIYIPENYNERYNGPVRLSVALGSSLNVPAVYLLERVGVQPFLDKLISAGFHSLKNKENLGVGLALGNGEVSLRELVQGFSIFSRGGNFIPLSYYNSPMENSPVRVFPPAVAETVRSILSNNKNRILGFGRSSPLDVGFDACFKTGTSNQFNNIWALGSTQDITVGVWMGNFSGETVIGSPGSSFPAGIVVSLLEDFHRVESFTRYENFKKRSICSLSGELAGSECPYVLSEYYPDEVKLDICDWHKGGNVILPYSYARWASIYHQEYVIDNTVTALEIEQPGDGSLFFLDPTLPGDSQAIAIRINGRNRVSLFIDDKLVHEDMAPFSYFHNVEKGIFNIRAVNRGNSVESVFVVK